MSSSLIAGKLPKSGAHMKTVIVYYSYEGSCAIVAGIIKNALNADVFEIKTVDEKKRTGFAKYFWGGKQVIFNNKPALRPLSVDINAYDLVILGTPVWAGSPAPAMVTFLDNAKISGKKLALFCSHGGGMGKVFDKIKALLPGNTFAGEINFLYAIKSDPAELKQKIGEWVKAIGA